MDGLGDGVCRLHLVLLQVATQLKQKNKILDDEDQGLSVRETPSPYLHDIILAEQSIRDSSSASHAEIDIAVQRFLDLRLNDFTLYWNSELMLV